MWGLNPGTGINAAGFLPAQRFLGKDVMERLAREHSDSASDMPEGYRL